MIRLPTFRPGQQLTAEDLNLLVDAINQAMPDLTRGGPGVLIGNHGSGRVVSARDQSIFRRRKSQASIVTFKAEVTGSTSIAPNRWSYSFAEVKYDTLGTYSTLPGGRTGTAYNDMEAKNTATGVQGCGINVDNLPPNWTIQPIGPGIVTMTEEIDCVTLATAYTFEASNNADGPPC